MFFVFGPLLRKPLKRDKNIYIFVYNPVYFCFDFVLITLEGASGQDNFIYFFATMFFFSDNVSKKVDKQ